MDWVEAVNADIKKSPSALLGEPAVVDFCTGLGESERKGELRSHVTDLAEISIVDQRRERDGKRMERRHVRLSKQDAGSIAGLEHPASVTR